MMWAAVNDTWSEDPTRAHSPWAIKLASDTLQMSCSPVLSIWHRRLAAALAPTPVALLAHTGARFLYSHSHQVEDLLRYYQTGVVASKRRLATKPPAKATAKLVICEPLRSRVAPLSALSPKSALSAASGSDGSDCTF